MSEKTLSIVQQFEKTGKKFVAGRVMQFAKEDEAIARAERDSTRMAGVVTIAQIIDLDTDEVVEELVVLARYGELPTEFSAQD